ncbi:cation transporting ATPase C-terminal domain-containing protein, partial [Salmonella sp. hn-h4]|uniref:cation transporting ATPase C-terminal domain-containing protein n=1 Tax=Salmonella sp. hn-h4 TaxID=2582612 RepID=UPI0013A9BBCF
YDLGQMTLPFDNVDKNVIKKPKKLNIKSLKRFMFFMGPISAVFNLLVFVALWSLFKVKDASTYQTIWFCYSIVSNLLGMHIIRTAKIPFI